MQLPVLSGTCTGASLGALVVGQVPTAPQFQGTRLTARSCPLLMSDVILPPPRCRGKGSKLQSLQNKDANMSMAGVLKQVEAKSYTLAFDEDF